MTEFTTWRSLVDGAEIIAIPESVVDNFEDSDDVDGAEEPFGIYDDGEDIVDYYPHSNGEEDGFYRDSGGLVGEFRARFDDPSNQNTGSRWSLPGDGLNYYPQPGDTIAWLHRDENEREPVVGFMVEDSSNPGCYGFSIVQDDNAIHIDKQPGLNVDRPDNDSGSGNLASSSLSVGSGWYWLEATLPTSEDDTILLEAYEVNTSPDPPERGDFLESVEANDDEYLGSRGIALYTRSSSGSGDSVDWIHRVD